MKVLYINVVLHTGSTGKIVDDITSSLCTENNFTYKKAYGRNHIGIENNTYCFCSELEANIHHIFVTLGFPQYGGNLLSTNRLIKYIKEEQPDIVHIHCINGFCVNIYHLLRFLANNNINTLITHHSEFYYTGNCSYSLDCNKWMDQGGCNNCSSLGFATYSRLFDTTHFSWLKMKDAFSYFNYNKLKFVAVSPWVASRHTQSPICGLFECKCILNGIDTSVFRYYDNNECKPIIDRLNLQGRKMILHVTASFNTSKVSLKGGRFLIDIARGMPDCLFVVASSYSFIQEELPNNIILWGKTKDQNELAMLYSIADLTLILSRKETFSMVVAESLCCGTPIVGFESGGPESICIPQYSAFVNFGNVTMLSEAVRKKLHSPVSKHLVSETAKDLYDKERMAREYLSIYKSFITNDNDNDD